jgi:DNA-binding NtrC family response regulator
MTQRHPVDFVFGSSLNPAMQEIHTTLKRVAASHVNVLLTGELGTGKEWAAHMIHLLSPRSAGPSVTVECAVIPTDQLERELYGYEAITWKGVDIKQGAFEQAHEGTLLLHEISQVPPTLLMRIARSVEFQRIRRIAAETEIPINARLIATMSVQFSHGGAHGPISEEVLQRLSPINIELPPLRRRREDLPALMNGFLQEMRERSGIGPSKFSGQALDACIRFDWPGNLRQLRQAIEYACVMCTSDVIQPEHLPAYVPVNAGIGGRP